MFKLVTYKLVCRKCRLLADKRVLAVDRLQHTLVLPIEKALLSR